MNQFLKKSFQLLLGYAAEHEDSEVWRLKKIIGVSTVILGVFTYPIYGLLYISSGEWLAGYIPLSASALFTLGLISYGIFRHYDFHWYFWIITHAVAVILVHIFLGGFTQAGMVIIWMILIPIQTLVAYKTRHGLLWFIIVAVVVFMTTFIQPYLRDTNNIPSSTITSLYVINTLGIATYMLLALYYYVWQNEILNKLVSKEQEKANALLLNILPKEIAVILKNENRVIADQFNNVSILFADVVNFTPMSATMMPSELVELLNEVFSCFDDLVESYNVEKIKTIGDCYMVAAGVPRQQHDHAILLTRFALDIRNYVAQREFCGKRLTFRIGINSGTVVAGVIGHKKFIYDLWGDAVNTASRMESHGTENAIQVTDATYQLIKDYFTCESRGLINVKGIGEMEVWHVLGGRMENNN